MKFFQIGLGANPEYAYLASRDASCYEKSRGLLQRVPPPLSCRTPWEGVLIEAHPFAFYQSYNSVRNKMPDALINLDFILGAISVDVHPFMPFSTRAKMEEHYGWSLPNVKAPGYTPHPLLKKEGADGTRFNVAAFTVNDLIDFYGVPDFVAMDLEGYELLVLAKFLEETDTKAYQVEAHSVEDTSMIRSMLENHGYEIVKSGNFVNDRTEMQAVK